MRMDPAGPPWLTVAALGAGVVAAVSAPEAAPGVGLLIGAVGVAAALLPAIRHRLDVHTVGLGAAALVLIAMAAVRDAPWLVALDLLAAGAVGSIALAGGRTWSELTRATTAVVVHTPMAPAYVGGSMSHLARQAPAGSVGPVLRGAAASLLLLTGFGSLFASADPAFADMADRILLPDVTVGRLSFRLFVLVAVAVLVAAGAAVARCVPAAGLTGRVSALVDGLLAPLAWRPPGRRRARIEWALPLALLDVLFASFVLLQAAVLFGGREHLLRTPGLTAAEYARQGFFQLLVVAALTLAVVAAAVRWVGDKDRSLLRALLGALCALTGGVLVSAAVRLHHYEQTFGHTRLRLVVGVAIVWIAIVFALVALAGARWQAGWLPRAVLGLAVIAMFGLNALNPDSFVARRNIDRYVTSGRIDIGYLSGLSADAVGELDKLPEPLRGCALAGQQRRLDWAASGGWQSANLARTRAQRLLDHRPAASPAACWSLDSSYR